MNNRIILQYKAYLNVIKDNILSFEKDNNYKEYLDSVDEENRLLNSCEHDYILLINKEDEIDREIGYCLVCDDIVIIRHKISPYPIMFSNNDDSLKRLNDSFIIDGTDYVSDVVDTNGLTRIIDKAKSKFIELLDNGTIDETVIKDEIRNSIKLKNKDVKKLNMG